MKKEISAGLIIYRLTANNDPRFLLLYHGGRYWNFPKGHIEETDEGGQPFDDQNQPETIRRRENSIQAAFRETMEETGLKRRELMLKRGFKVYQKYRFFRRKTPIFKTVIYYLAETKVRQINISDEHEGYGWFSYKDALFILGKYKDNQEILRKAYNFIRSRFLSPSRQSEKSVPVDAVQN